VGQAFEQFGKGSFGAMPAVYKGRNDRDTQVSASSGAQVWPQER
jgi:hypothetical protein